MTMSKKRKRILWIAIPVAVIAIAALLVWLLLGQPEPEKPFEILRSQTTGNIVDCQLREGAVEATGDGSTPQPYYILTPPQGWTPDSASRNPLPLWGRQPGCVSIPGRDKDGLLPVPPPRQPEHPRPLHPPGGAVWKPSGALQPKYRHRLGRGAAGLPNHLPGLLGGTANPLFPYVLPGFRRQPDAGMGLPGEL